MLSLPPALWRSQNYLGKLPILSKRTMQVLYSPSNLSRANAITLLLASVSKIPLCSLHPSSVLLLLPSLPLYLLFPRTNSFAALSPLQAYFGISSISFLARARKLPGNHYKINYITPLFLGDILRDKTWKIRIS